MTKLQEVNTVLKNCDLFVDSDDSFCLCRELICFECHLGTILVSGKKSVCDCICDIDINVDNRSVLRSVVLMEGLKEKLQKIREDIVNANERGEST